MRRKLGVVLLVALFGVAVYAGTVLATPQTGVSTTTVAKGAFDGLDVKTAYKTADRVRHDTKVKTNTPSDVYVVSNTFDPGGTSGWHTHPGPSLIVVTAGQITAYDGDDTTCTPKVYTAGQGFVDPGAGHVHLLRNETTAPATTIAIQILPRDSMRRIDVTPGPGHCPF